MLTKDTLVKMLDPDRMPAHGGTGQWPEPGTWREVDGELVPCENGLHVCTIRDALTHWAAPEMWVVEVDGERIAEADKTVVRRARLVSRVETWNDRILRLFAADCAEAVLPIFERQYPGDLRLRQVIIAARQYADGEIGAAAWAVARDAAWDAAGDAARAVARDAAWAAAKAVAWAVARDAAWAAAWAAAWDAAWGAQVDRLLPYLNGEVGA